MSKDVIILVIALLAVYNLVVFCVYGYDKSCAIKDKWRVPEKVLIALAFLGGSVGAYLGMSVFRHKTKHTKFTVLVPLALLIHIVLVVWLVVGRK
ncbi:MAG: DUF1294 domain-containing protein [Lachnospiraceae bacterium]|nr:DUF1294 domain-containing protein [Lachnospiraceae bacterium]MBQ8167497.1 DUF1294 domain-containing protein [Lachnospiraceae bacterium]